MPDKVPTTYRPLEWALPSISLCLWKNQARVAIDIEPGSQEGSVGEDEPSGKEGPGADHLRFVVEDEGRGFDVEGAVQIGTSETADEASGCELFSIPSKVFSSRLGAA